MKITSKGQVTIPQAVREQAGLHPHCEVEFEVQGNGDVLVRLAAAAPVTRLRQSFERVRGRANAAAFKGMGTDEFMAFLRG
ncbi:MAG: AbrB/MazE/SpoVT family DNA-binding domain-containing protein [Rhodoferax sp.]|jgi:AbrB family looped-hinge helix DNA binding protein|uniref:AbrB/MazE/SpoVT family DNA-binding domain-containing protein n=1 Tax=Rhodoferax sp. TaxID=50421 RepID=UPI001B5C07D2|nr:AbrB/MazE/SpoVT family DNA-binding domain-containing protein [Rhodoferax sp.]MBP9150496.1 AbrB/MazE/SpoVT family DNA-binding domain-containing protein [Rhodoferax sp.]MBP9734830.1 AbrB/MazE/SpoVT family DNA-binding domain-containing protein [Rhodoferax sp.]